MSEFETWWYNEGSQAPNKDDDCETHCKKMCEIAWSKGDYKARRELEKQLAEAQEQLKTAKRDTVLKLQEKAEEVFNSVVWGWDGDCGSERDIDIMFEQYANSIEVSDDN